MGELLWQITVFRTVWRERRVQIKVRICQSSKTTDLKFERSISKIWKWNLFFFIPPRNNTHQGKLLRSKLGENWYFLVSPLPTPQMNIIHKLIGFTFTSSHNGWWFPFSFHIWLAIFNFSTSLCTIAFWCSPCLTFSGWHVSLFYALPVLHKMEYTQLLLMLSSVESLTEEIFLKNPDTQK